MMLKWFKNNVHNWYIKYELARTYPMSGEYGNDYVTISDDEGNDFVLEHLDTIEVDDSLYMAFLPTDLDEDDDDYGLILLEVIEEDGEEVLVSIDDDDTLESIYKCFMERLLSDE